MLSSTQTLAIKLPPMDCGSARFSFLLLGGAEHVKNAVHRREENGFKVLVAITLSFSVLATFLLANAGNWELGILIGSGGLIAAAIGSSIFWLAHSSFEAQTKSGNCVEAIEARLRFAARLEIAALRLSIRRISDLSNLLRFFELIAIQRQFSAIAHIIHSALSAKLLAIPFRLR